MTVVASIRTRLTSLEKKLEVISKRNAIATQPAPSKRISNPAPTTIPAVASTPPK